MPSLLGLHGLVFICLVSVAAGRHLPPTFQNVTVSQPGLELTGKESLDGHNVTSPLRALNGSLVLDNKASDTDLAGVLIPYWVDSTCSGAKDLSGHLAEKVEFACAVEQSLRPDVVDDDFAYVFQRLFQASPHDGRHEYEKTAAFMARFGSRRRTAKVTVYEHMRSICSQWTQTSVRQEAVLRIYCDNGAHFTQTVPATGSQAAGVFDPVNGIISAPHCVDPEVQAVVASFRTAGPAYVNESPDRSMLTICNSAWDDQNKGSFYNLGPDTDFTTFVDENGNLNRASTTDFESVSLVLLHEWTHSWPYFLEDCENLNSAGNPIPDSAYDWEELVKMPTVLALQNAETYKHLGLLAWLARQSRPHNQFPGERAGGFSLQRPPRASDPVTLQQHEQAIRRGEMAFYHDITTPGNVRGPNPAAVQPLLP